MGVIGRLDDQVDELIIKPLGERGRSEPPAPSKNVEPAHADSGPESSAEDENKSGGRHADLPVWLL